jgi:hypothetical protein
MNLLSPSFFEKFSKDWHSFTLTKSSTGTNLFSAKFFGCIVDLNQSIKFFLLLANETLKRNLFYFILSYFYFIFVRLPQDEYERPESCWTCITAYVLVTSHYPNDRAENGKKSPQISQLLVGQRLNFSMA